MINNNIFFILNKPQLSENIGACARAIKNFSFKKLVLINPKPIFPNDKILATSVGAKDIIKQSKKYVNLEKALRKIDVVIATSSRFRNKNIKHINLEDLKKIDFKKKIGFLFGSEASGLSNDEISYANYTLHIPTNPDFKSLNLSHSLIIIAQYVASIVKLRSVPFKKLVLINPKPIFPNDKILATSVGAKDIIKQSKKYDNLEKALNKIDIVIATSARFRNKNIKHINLDDLKKINFKKNVGFLFGSEASGLSNNEISYANYTLQIPTNPDFKSLNLSHSLIIIAQYVASIIKLRSVPFKKSKKIKSASKKDLQSMLGLCVKNLEEINFFRPKEKRPKMIENLRNIFYKMDLSDKETRILSSVFVSLGKKRWLTKLWVSL